MALPWRRTLRKAKNYVPVLMLTARRRPEDVLEGFAAGADDYLPKPFELPIFLARLQGLLRRSAWLAGASRTKVAGREARCECGPKRSEEEVFRSTERPSISGRWSCARMAQRSI